MAYKAAVSMARKGTFTCQACQKVKPSKQALLLSNWPDYMVMVCIDCVGEELKDWAVTVATVLAETLDNIKVGRKPFSCYHCNRVNVIANRLQFICDDCKAKETADAVGS